MSTPEIDTLRAEVAQDAAIQAETEAAPAPEPTLPPAPDPGLSMALSGVVMAVSKPVCRKARVTDLQPTEAEALGASLAVLVEMYDIGPKDPRAAAWMGLGLTVVGIIGNRQRLPDTPQQVGEVIPEQPGTIFTPDNPRPEQWNLNLKPMVRDEA
jgi:hypothetical protein